MSSTFRLTEEQINYYDSLKVKALDNFLNGRKSAYLNDYNCFRYLKIQNETFHKPACYAKDYNPKTKEVYIEAIFFGSGMLSHPVKEAWVPLSALEIKLTLELFRKLLKSNYNYLRCIFDKEFKKELLGVSFKKEKIDPIDEEIRLTKEKRKALVKKLAAEKMREENGLLNR